MTTKPSEQLQAMADAYRKQAETEENALARATLIYLANSYDSHARKAKIFYDDTGETLDEIPVAESTK